MMGMPATRPLLIPLPSSAETCPLYWRFGLRRRLSVLSKPCLSWGRTGYANSVPRRGGGSPGRAFGVLCTRTSRVLCDIHSLARPGREVEAALEHIEWHRVVLHRAGTIRIGLERVHAGALVVGPARR